MKTNEPIILNLVKNVGMDRYEIRDYKEHCILHHKDKQTCLEATRIMVKLNSDIKIVIKD